MKRSLAGSIALTRLKHIITHVVKKDGTQVPGIFIPFDANHMEQDQKHPNIYYLPVRVHIREEADRFGQHGFIAQSAGKAWSKATDQEKEELNNLPILGNLKDFEASTGDISNEFEKTDIQMAATSQEDDLPF